MEIPGQVKVELVSQDVVASIVSWDTDDWRDLGRHLEDSLVGKSHSDCRRFADYKVVAAAAAPPLCSDLNCSSCVVTSTVLICPGSDESTKV